MIATTTKPVALTSDRAAQIREAYAAQRAKGLRAKDAAEAAGSSEGEAIAAHAVQLLAVDARETSPLQVQPAGAVQGGLAQVAHTMARLWRSQR